MTLKKISYWLVTVATMVTIVIGLSRLSEFSLGGLLFLFSAIIPYILMTFVVSLVVKHKG